MPYFGKNVISDSEIEEYRMDSNVVIAKLANEVYRLRQGIREHKSRTGHSLCWLNDVALWELVDEHTEYPHDTLPVREEFLANCQRYYQSRLEGTPWADPPVERSVVDLAIERQARAQTVRVTDEELIVELDDGRTISVPLTWFPRLLHGTPEERATWRLIRDGEEIHWPGLDEDIEMRHLLAGIPSQESSRSLQQWLQEREQRNKPA